MHLFPILDRLGEAQSERGVSWASAATRGAGACSQKQAPLLPPDPRTAGQPAHPERSGFELSWSAHLFPSGVKIFFSHSYVMKYIPLAGTSVSGKRGVS